MKRLILIATFLLLTLSLSACSGSFAPTSWPGLSLDPAGETAFLAYQNQVYAVDAATGSLKWKYPSEPDRKRTFFAPPVYTPNGELLAGGYDNILVSLDPALGTENWIFDAGSRIVGAPLATEEAVYLPTAGGDLFALDLEGHPIWDAPFHSEKDLWAPPVLDNGVLYVGGMDHNLYALDASDGSIRWQTPLGGAINSAPLLHDGVLYLGTFAQQVVAVDAEIGTILWDVSTDGWVWATPQTANGLLYLGDVSGAFYALNMDDGSLAWQSIPDGPIVSQALIGEDTVYFTTESGTLYAVDAAKGSPVWEYSVEKGKLYTAPQAVDGDILIAPTGGDSLLIAVNAETGTQRWQFTPEKK